jgi:hypothetical protein
MNKDDTQETLIFPQYWKFYVGGVGGVILGVGLYATDYFSNLFDIDPNMFRLCTVSFGLLLFAYSIFSVSCPSCGLALVGYSMSKQPHNLWHNWLLNLKSCPKCGFTRKQ